ncbi:MAG: T9SS type A sorting domain-containing protein [candidate division WOR-3 bacterium]
MINSFLLITVFLQLVHSADSIFLTKAKFAENFQDSINIRCLAHYPYAAGRAIAMDSNAVFVSSGTAILIFDRENPQAPISSIITRHFVAHLFRSEQYLYVLSGEFPDLYTNLIIYDVSEPSLPRLICQHRIEGVCRGIYVRGRFAYVTSIYLGNLGGLRIFDVSNPANPFQVSYLPLPGVGPIDISDNYAFLVGAGFYIIDISNPYEPTQIYRWQAPGNLYTVGDANIKCVGNILYFSVGVYEDDLEYGGLLTFNITNPSNPVLIGFHIFYNVETSMSECLNIEDTFAYITYLSFGVIVANISNPANPIVISQYEPRSFVRQHTVSNRIVYLVTTYAYEKIDFSNFQSPTLLFRYGTEFPGFINDVWIKNDYAFIVTGSFPLAVFDISNLSQISPCYLFQDTSIRYHWSNSLYLVDTMLYIAGPYFYIFNIANPQNPIFINRCVLPFEAFRVKVRGNYAYFASNWGLGIYDITNLNNPVLVGQCNIPGGGAAWDMELVGNRAYLAGYRSDVNGLFCIIDISNPHSPYFLCNYPLTSDPFSYGVTVRNDTAYISLDTGILILNCANPYYPLVIRRISLPRTQGSALKLIGNRLYACWGYDGFYILDISNLTTPEIIGYYNTPGFTKTAFVTDNLILTADDWGGYHILQYLGAGFEQTESKRLVPKFKLKILPQPTKNSILIKYSVSKQSIVSLDILDTLGRIKKNIKKEQIKPGNYQMNIDVSDLPAGVYFVRLKQEKEQVIERLVIAK